MPVKKLIDNIAATTSSVILAKDGAYTLQIDGNFVHSKYAPLKEALRLVDRILELDSKKTLVIVLGAGLGYHLDILYDAGFINIIVIERNPKVFEIFQKVYNKSYFKYVIGPDEPVEVIDSIFSTIDIEKFKDIKTVQLRGGYKSELYADFEERIERLMKVKLGDFSTRLKFEELWFSNIIKNIVNYSSSYTVDSLIEQRHNAKQVPIVVVSAGPSLRFSLSILKELADYVVTIAVDTALLPMYETGIVPDFVYSLDSQIHNLPDFSMIDKEFLAKTTLVYDTVVNPKLSKYFGGQKIISNTAHLDFDYDGNPFVVKSNLVKWIENISGIRFGDIETGGSVATSAFHLAYLLGAEPLILVGQDLAYSYKTSHCISTPHFYRIARTSNRLKTMETIFLSIMKKRRGEMINGVCGKVFCDFVLNNYKGWFEESAKNIKRLLKNKRLINASVQGVKLKNYEHIDLANLKTELQKNGKIDKTKIFHSLNLIDLSKVDKIIVCLKKLQDFLLKLRVDTDIFDIINNSEFDFLTSYFMKSKVIFDRYENFEKDSIRRKINRLVKNISGVIDGLNGKKRT